LVTRIANALNARRRRGRINHVLGDTHYLANFLPRRGTLITIHDCVSLERLRGLRRSMVWLFNYWWPLKHATEVVVVSEFTRRSLHRWISYPDARITVIPPPLSPEFAEVPPRPHGQWSRLLHIGVAENKNLERVAEALSGLDVTLAVVGRPTEAQRRALERHGVRYEVHAHLDRMELLEQYALADVLLFASTYEGFGMPIIEAQAVGRPVVTSNAASMPEAAGGAACLVDPFDPTSIRAGIMRVLRDPHYAAQLIEAGRRNAKKYAVARVAEGYAQVYRRLGQSGAG
jgi:glycosyltransferase involved in cell wall biosynthesis